MIPASFGMAMAGLGLSGIGTIFAVYPAALWLAGKFAPVRTPPPPSPLPRVTAIVAFHGGEEMLSAKVANLLALDYPADRLDAVFASDGTMPEADRLPAEFSARGWRILATGIHLGKTHALNLAAGAATGDILLFTDLDARLAPDSLRRMIKHFGSPGVGGVCGRRVIDEPGGAMDRAQADYARGDGWVKERESRLGFLTSNDGKLYALRRALFRPLPEGVTDDLYAALLVVDQGRRMVYEPTAIAAVPKPARSPRHEMARRRRIVNPSLRGIFLLPRVLDPRRTGAFAVGLLINKVLRRMLPLFLAATLAGALLAIPESRPMAVLAFAQLGFYALAALHPALSRMPSPNLLRRLAGLAFYFTIGNIAMGLGVVDFLRGRRVAKWTPVKTDAPGH